MVRFRTVGLIVFAFGLALLASCEGPSGKSTPSKPSPSPTDHPGTVVATIALDGSPKGIAVDRKDGEIYVTAYGLGIEEIGPGSNSITKRIAVGGPLGPIVINSSEPTAWVARNDSITKVDLHTGSTVSTVQSGRYPVCMRSSSTPNRIYVANFYDKSIGVVDGTTGRLTGTIQLGAIPQCLAISSDGKHIYIPTEPIPANLPTPDSVMTVDAESGHVSASVNVGQSVTAIAPIASSNRIYVASSGDFVSVVDASTNAVLGRVTLAVGSYSVDIAASNDGQYVYTADSGRDTVSAISTTTDQKLWSVRVGRHPTTLTLSPDGKRLYVIAEESREVSVIAL